MRGHRHRALFKGGNRLRILVSNDDGIDAPGIHALVNALAPLCEEIIVAAPDSQRSASSHSIGLFRPLTVERVSWPGPGSITAYRIHGTPVDCVKWAVCEAVGGKPCDLMVSGINEGPNLATDVLYSGTVAAAGEAALQGLRAVALSLAGPPFPFEDAALAAVRIVQAVSRLNFPPDTFVNVNLPGSHPHTAAWRVVPLGARKYKDKFRRIAGDDETAVWRYAGEALIDDGNEASDVSVVRQGGVAITPLRYHFTADDWLSTLKTQLEDTAARKDG
ncbi:MAG: 5'/3'-nucleotidase SurE [Thermoflavifilum sp.]|nr:5'/3'-nucleotidase SurE [Thermoflavifilum sp.]MCL6513926.1 5'/3'-nucleotidase SurE [Alicyclobacillus sp.]